VDTATGEQQWAFETGGSVFSSPTVADGTVYVGSANGSLYAVDSATGEEQWAFETGNPVTSSPTVADGTVYVGSLDTTVADETVYVGSKDENLYAVDAATGEQQWAFETGDRVESSPTVADGIVYVGSFDDNLYAVDAATGDEQWAFETGGSVASSPTVADGTVYVGSKDDNLYAITASVEPETRGSQPSKRVPGMNRSAIPEDSSQGHQKSHVLNQLREMDPYEFEELVAKIWERQGWDAEATSCSTDRGVDVIATKEDALENRRHLIQVKRHGENTTVGSEDIQRYASLYQRDEQVDNVFVVTSNRFTSEAEEVAKRRDVSTLNGDELYKMLIET
jgi:hypothetical protein